MSQHGFGFDSSTSQERVREGKKEGGGGRREGGGGREGGREEGRERRREGGGRSKQTSQAIHRRLRAVLNSRVRDWS